MRPPSADRPSHVPAREARRITVRGIVQGVGFRPFVYRLATDLGIDGHVRNTAGQVEIDAAADPAVLDRFVERLQSDAPPRARVEAVAVSPLSSGSPMPSNGSGFSIVESAEGATTERLFPPDIATCDDCLRELLDPSDRRYRYPFINCTNCGPRATIIDELPYDRTRTSMHVFPLCGPCAAEYRDPANRRFHAEPVACPVCGPSLAYRSGSKTEASARREDALAAAAADIAGGRVVAVKGLGGYHLACDATNEDAVGRLRDRKHRWAKPFAVMVRDLEAARRQVELSEEETELLVSPARPIVLALRRADAVPRIVDNVAAGTDRLGIFLPYTPLHHLLLAALDRPIVLTSANLSDEPLVTDDDEALERLAAIADSFLQHDREIRARYDDSVTRVVGRRESIVRRARGYAPDPLELPVSTPVPLLAVGAELKHTFTLARGSRAHVAPHTGDLEDLLTHRAFEGNLAHLSRLLALEPEVCAHDLHPGYLSTQYAAGRFPPERRLAVQHHHAHVASCAAEHGLHEPFIGIAYDGLGMGDDGTLWGGEVLVADLRTYRRVGRFALAPMPGGAVAVQKPYRMALGFLFGVEDAPGMGEWLPRDLVAPFLSRLEPREVDIVRVQVDRGLNTPLASSAGRLFDAVSSLLGIRDIVEYEAQAAIDLEMAAEPGEHEPLPYRVARRDDLLVYDPRPTLRRLLEDLAAGVPSARLAARFQETIAEVTRQLCADVRAATGLRSVCLSGGVFQNDWLATTLVVRLDRDGFEVHINHQVPANDGGISYGQAAVAAALLGS